MVGLLFLRSQAISPAVENVPKRNQFRFLPPKPPKVPRLASFVGAKCDQQSARLDQISALGPTHSSVNGSKPSYLIVRGALHPRGSERVVIGNADDVSPHLPSCSLCGSADDSADRKAG